MVVYGGDHSPWVQALLLGLHERRVAYTLITFPPKSLRCESGVLMPAMRDGDGHWRRESAELLAELGYEPISERQMRELAKACIGGHHRIDSAWRFWHAWSLVADHDPRWFARLANAARRPFSVLYFHLLLARLAPRVRPLDGDSIRHQYRYWLERLETHGPFLHGEAPNTLDFMLFGGLQCHASIEVPPIAALQHDPELAPMRTWIATMQRRFADYPHLYSGAFFEPKRAAPAKAPLTQRVAFWLGAMVTLVAAPLTVRQARQHAKRVRALGYV